MNNQSLSYGRLQVDIDKVKSSPPRSEKVKYAESRWALLLGEYNWDILLPNVENALYRTRGEEIMYKKILSRRLEVNHYRTANGSERQCSYCRQEETIEHLYGECESTKKYLGFLRKLISHQLGIEIPVLKLRDLIYFFPQLSPSLNSQQLRILGIAHSLSLLAIWEGRKAKDPSDFAIQYFNERFYARLNYDPSRRGSDASDASNKVPSLTSISAGSGSPFGKDFTDVLMDILHSKVEKFDHDEALGNLLALYE